MKKNYFHIIFFLLTACSEDSPKFSVSRDKSLIDTGIYDSDSVNNTTEEEFKNDIDNASLPQVGTMSPLIKDELILEYTPCTDVKISSSCWDGVKTSKYCKWDQMFTRYENGWTGADATYSVPLPDGRVLWMFGDTFIGTVNEDRTRNQTKMINNTFVLTDENEFVTLFGGTRTNPRALVVPNETDDWYWPFDATIYNGELHMLLAHMQRVGEGMWGFAYKQVDLAIFSLPDLTLKSLTMKIPSPEISYGSTLMEDTDYTYIYGITTVGYNKYAHVARASSGNLRTVWEFYNGSDWVLEPSNYRIHDGVSDQFSVFKKNGKYYLLTHQIIFGSEIQLFESDFPIGPWHSKKTVYCTPETGGDVFTYNSFVHPELSINDELIISYNINSFDFWSLFDNADLYRPKFIKVENWQ